MELRTSVLFGNEISLHSSALVMPQAVGVCLKLLDMKGFVGQPIGKSC